MRSQIVFYKKYRHVMQWGTCYRLLSPYSMKNCAMQFISEDKSTVIVFYFTIHTQPKDYSSRMKLMDLESEAVYREHESGLCYGGDMLMNAGLKIRDVRDFESKVMIFEKQ